MSQNLNAPRTAPPEPDPALLAEFGSLWAEADDLWERQQNSEAFHGYVSADYRAVYDSFVGLRGRVSTVLEWGSGLGIVTIMASRLGFESYGIESESGLVEHAKEFAQTYGPNARFAQGSFIPDDYQRTGADRDQVLRTMVDAPSAYDPLKMDLRDFDLIYVYPFPNEQALCRDIMSRFARRDALLLIYDARTGINLVRFDNR